VIIAGGGTVGLSTAWYLAQSNKNYSSITVLDPYPPPAYASAGNDINKVIRNEYDMAIYSVIADEALDIWMSNPIFKDYYHNVGHLSGSFEGPPYSDWNLTNNNTFKYTDASRFEVFGANISTIFAERWPVFKNGPPPDFLGAINGRGGWANAAGAMKALGEYLKTDKRIHFVNGEQGTAKGLIKSGAKVTGVRTADGSAHHGDLVILSMGAWTSQIIDLEGQGWPDFSFVTSIQLTEQEIKELGQFPVVDLINPGLLPSQTSGYFFPPNEDGLLKIVAKIDGHFRYTRKTSNGMMYVVKPSEAHDPKNKLPLQDAIDWRQFITYWLPQIGYKNFTKSSACWDLATFDGYWILGPHPSSPESLFIATGGNGNTFKNLVNIGKYVVQFVEGTLSSERQETFRWRP
ncbi:nucleotide-binding domain-containing protein, partial [Rhizodiscina lignyota]